MTGASLAKVFQVLVVAEHPNRVSSPLHIHPPLSECLHHCQQLFIIYRVVQLRRCDFPFVKTEGVQIASKRGLRKNAPEGEVGRISLHCEGHIWLVVAKMGAEVKACWRERKVASALSDQVNRTDFLVRVVRGVARQE